MKLNEYIKMWDDYFIESLKTKDYIPTNPTLKKYYDSYNVCKGHSKKEVDYIPEPFFGDIKKASVVIINTNPGGILPFQSWKDGDFPSEMRESLNGGSFTPYSDWAKKFIYFDDKVNYDEKAGNGKDFWRNRLKYINSVIDTDITKENLFAFEIYPWHSKSFDNKKFKDKSSIINEFILEPIMDMENVKYVFFLRTPTVEAMKESEIKFEDIQHNWDSKELKVCMANYKGKLFIGTINNFSGYPGIKGNDIKELKKVIKEYANK